MRGGASAPRFSGRPICGVAVLEFFDDFVGEGAASGDFAEVFGHLAEDVGGSVGEEEDGVVGGVVALAEDVGGFGWRYLAVCGWGVRAHGWVYCFTHLTSWMTFSTGVPGTIPWPRLKMWPGRLAAAARISLVRAWMTS